MFSDANKLDIDNFFLLMGAGLLKSLPEVHLDFAQ